MNRPVNSNSARHTTRPKPLNHKRLRRRSGPREGQSNVPRVVNQSSVNQRHTTQARAARGEAPPPVPAKSIPSPELLSPIARITAVLPFFGTGELEGLAEYLEAELSSRLMKSRRR